MNPPKMPIHIGDLLRDTGHLRAMLIGAYMLLLFHHWSTGALPDDDNQLSAIARMTSAEWRKAKPILEKFFEPGWIHGRVQEDLASAKASYEARAKAGEKGGKAKAEAKQNPSNATAGPEQPLTLDQIPNTKEEKKDRTRAVALDDDWPADFGDQFWQAYPRKTEKLSAMKRLSSLRKGGTVTFQDLMAGVSRYAAAVSHNDPKFTKQPTTWLNAGCWADETQPGGSNGARNFDQKRGSANADFFAGMRGVAQDLAGHDPAPRDAAAEIPVGRVNIEH